MPQPKIGLALSGGGARGFAHIGILKALQNAGIHIDCISGTSMGGLIAAAFACGIPLETIEQKALQLSHMRELVKLVDVSRQRRGLLEGSRVRDFLVDLFLDRSFETLKIPLAMPAVDLVRAQEVVFTSGMVLPAVLATSAVPALFQPIELNGQRLVDGGVLNNLPVDLARRLGADRIIAVDVQFDPAAEKPWQDQPPGDRFPFPAPSFFLDFYRAELIMIAEITRMRLNACPPDLLLRPSIPTSITMFLGFTRIPEIIAAGEHCAIEAMPSIIRLLQAEEIQPSSQNHC